MAVRGQGVGHARRALLVRRGGDDPLALEPAQPVGQDVRGDARQRLPELVEPPRPIEQRLDDQQAPAIADAVEGRLEASRRRGRGRRGLARSGSLIAGSVGAGRGLSRFRVGSRLQVTSLSPADRRLESRITRGATKPMSAIEELQTAVATVAERVGPSIVGIGRGTRGSGVVIADGTVLTNAHNLRGDEVTVTFADGRRIRGTVARRRRRRRPRGHRRRHRRRGAARVGPMAPSSTVGTAGLRCRGVARRRDVA